MSLSHQYPQDRGINDRYPFSYGQDVNFGFSHYGEHWRLCRRIFQQTFRANAALNFRPMQFRTVRQLIFNVIYSPDEYLSHFST